jgi:hypothetical protein
MDSCLLPILDLANAGSVSVTKAPTKHHDDSWIANTLEKQLLEVEDVLRECIKSSMERFADCSESDILVEADREISQDLVNMELQPTFMDNYRRFVVIRAASEETRSLPEGGLGVCSVVSPSAASADMTCSSSGLRYQTSHSKMITSLDHRFSHVIMYHSIAR